MKFHWKLTDFDETCQTDQDIVWFDISAKIQFTIRTLNENSPVYDVVLV